MIYGAKRMAIAKRHYPNLLKMTRVQLEDRAKDLKADLKAKQEEDELDPVEVDNAVRNTLMAVYALQEDVTLMQEKVGGAIRRGEIAEDDEDASVSKVATAT